MASFAKATRAARERIDDAERGRQLLRGVLRQVSRRQRQSRGHLPCLVREDRGQGGLDGLAGHDLIVLIDEDDIEQPRRIERGDARVFDLHDHGGLHLVVRHRRAGLLQRVAHGGARGFGARQLAADGGVLPGIPLALLLQLGDEVPAGPLQGRLAEGIIVVAHAVSLRDSGGVAARVRACVDQVLGHPGLFAGCIQGKTDDGLVTARGDRVQEGVNLREVVGVVSGDEVFTGKGAHSSV